MKKKNEKKEKGEVAGKKAGKGAGACVNGISRSGGGALGRFRLGAAAAGNLSHRGVQISIPGAGPAPSQSPHPEHLEPREGRRILPREGLVRLSINASSKSLTRCRIWSSSNW